VCHTSPDGSFSVLREFLQGTGKRLTMGIFDLTAPHVVEALKESLEAPPRKFLLVLDPKIALGNGGSGDNPKAKDLEETAVRDDLEAALRDRFEFVWAAVKLRGKTNGGLFDSAYHIKVAVRDGKSFWLSSGNLQSTNQPDHDLPPKPAANDLRRFNREWHVIVHNPTLAAVLEDYVQFDFQQAQRFQAETGERAFAPQFDLLVPRGVSRPRLLKTFRPKTFAKKVTVRALLTPDNYGPAVLELIESAKKTVYFQNQYIHLGPANKRPKGFQDLCTALKKKIDAGKDVRIILRDLGDTRKMLEELEDFGIPGDNIRLQVACHNKGIVVDSQQVLVGSHNWSGAGTTTNRDASLIFDDPDVAKYYEEVFRYDWENQARQVSSGERAMPVAIPRGIRVTAEHVRHFPSGVPVYRVSWDDYFEG
jgi:hypothetical protein